MSNNNVEDMAKERIEQAMERYFHDPSPYHVTEQLLGDFFHDVISWNAFARGNEDFKYDDLVRQNDLVSEELKETDDACRENDFKEIIDGICDVMVVGSYRTYIRHRLAEEKDDITPLSRNEVVDIMATHEYQGFAYPILVEIYMEMYEVNSLSPGILGYEMRRVLDQKFPDGVNLSLNLSAVMQSNWSKFPLVEDIVDIDAELAAIEASYAEQGKPLKAVASKRVDDLAFERYVFHNAETGKVIKPTTFEKPKLVF